MTGIQSRVRRRAGLALTAVLALSAVAACGSEDDAASDGGGSEQTIKVMVFGPFDAKGFSEPWVETGAQAGVDKVNAAGGIDGRELELISCNDNNDPNTAAGCARQAVRDGVVAVIGGISIFEAQILPVLDKAGIPVLATTPIGEFTSPSLYAISGGGAGQMFGLGKTLAEDPVCGGKVAGLIEDFAATQGAIGLFSLGVQAAGGEYTGTSSAPQGSADFAPAAAAAGGQAPCVGFLTGPQVSAQAARSLLQTNGVELVGTSDSVLGDAPLAALGDDGDGIIVTSAFKPLNESTDSDAMREFLEAGLAIDEDFAPDLTAAAAYLGPQILQQAMEGASEVTTDSIKAGLEKLSGYDTGLGPIVDFTTTNPSKAFSRLPVSTPLFRWVAQGGRYVDAGEAPIDISDVYEFAALAGQ